MMDFVWNAVFDAVNAIQLPVIVILFWRQRTAAYFFMITSEVV